jgi:protein-S-isoprenylcysteine O-methyltransferase Ste14
MKTLENKIPPPVLVLIIGTLMACATHFVAGAPLPEQARFAISVLCGLIGLVFGLSAFFAFGRAKTTIDPVYIERASTLVTSGIYRYSRNPMYVALTALLLCWAAYLSSWWGFAGPLFFVLFIDRFQIRPEERVMKAKFEPSYEAYCRDVRRWL